MSLGNLLAIAAFIRSHGLPAEVDHVFWLVRFTCADGDDHEVDTMWHARRILGY